MQASERKQAKTSKQRQACERKHMSAGRRMHAAYSKQANANKRVRASECKQANATMRILASGCKLAVASKRLQVSEGKQNASKRMQASDGSRLPALSCAWLRFLALAYSLVSFCSLLGAAERSDERHSRHNSGTRTSFLAMATDKKLTRSLSEGQGLRKQRMCAILSLSCQFLLPSWRCRGL